MNRIVANGGTAASSAAADVRPHLVSRWTCCFATGLFAVALGCTDLSAGTSVDSDSSGAGPLVCSTPVVYYLDSDGDGTGTANVRACEALASYVEQAGDCNDECPTCNPKGVEDCDGLDNDCDGEVDEDLDMRCGKDVGICTEGQRHCVDGTWTACDGNSGTEEQCGGAGEDEDCDSAVDEGCPCMTGSTRDCGSAEGVCQSGTQRCEDGMWRSCEGATAGEVERCDGLDNDCDGEVDESLTRACGSDVGVCETGMQTCEDGAWGACLGEVPPDAEETCDKRDNDCDGVIDEALTRTCGPEANLGQCRLGRRNCTDGVWGPCEGAVLSAPERCDAEGRDENCDGQVNEGCECRAGETQLCGTNEQGACTLGIQECAGRVWGACDGATQPRAEVCDSDRIDEDCDGVANNGCECDEGAVRTCGRSDVGQCTLGSQTCMRGRFGPCIGAVNPSTEICDPDANDEDCDGNANEGCGCEPGDTQACGSSQGVCSSGTQTCEDGDVWGPCQDAVLPTRETCDGRDEDCDGTVDNGDLCGRGRRCVDGACECAQRSRDCGDGRCVGLTECCHCREEETCVTNRGSFRGGSRGGNREPQCQVILSNPTRVGVDDTIERPVWADSAARIQVNGNQFCTEIGYPDGLEIRLSRRSCGEPNTEYMDYDGSDWRSRRSGSDPDGCFQIGTVVACRREDSPP